MIRHNEPGDRIQARTVGEDSVRESRGVLAPSHPGTVAEAACVWVSPLSGIPTLCRLPIRAATVNNLNQKIVSEDTTWKNLTRAVYQRELLFPGGLSIEQWREQRGQDLLAPGWTNYRKVCLYDTHDLTARLQSGVNELRVMLGNGFFHIPGGRHTKLRGTFGPPMLTLQLRVRSHSCHTFVLA